MAKLNGVKTIDMVNGEITKVSYGGSEYTLLPKSNEGKAQMGDLVLITDDTWCDSTKGEFYRVASLQSDSKPKIIDDIGEVDGNFYDGSYEVFRKISAEQLPTIDERVSKLEADVDELKGEQAIEAPYIPQEGDIVVVIANNTGSHNKIGDIGKVGEDKPLRDGGVCVYVPNGPTSGVRTLPKDIRKATRAEVVAYEQAVKDAEKKAEEAKESAKWAKIGREVGEYMKGDIVRIVRPRGSGFIVGSLGTVAVSSVEDDFSPRVTAYAVDENSEGTYWAEVELVAPVESLV